MGININSKIKNNFWVSDKIKKRKLVRRRNKVDTIGVKINNKLNNMVSKQVIEKKLKNLQKIQNIKQFNTNQTNEIIHTWDKNSKDENTKVKLPNVEKIKDNFSLVIETDKDTLFGMINRLNLNYELKFEEDWEIYKIEPEKNEEPAGFFFSDLSEVTPKIPEILLNMNSNILKKTENLNKILSVGLELSNLGYETNSEMLNEELVAYEKTIPAKDLNIKNNNHYIPESFYTKTIPTNSLEFSGWLEVRQKNALSGQTRGDYSISKNTNGDSIKNWLTKNKMNSEDKVYMLSGVTKPIWENSEILEKATRKSEKKSSVWVSEEINLTSEYKSKKKAEEILSLKRKPYLEQLYKKENRNINNNKEKTVTWFNDLAILRGNILKKNENKSLKSQIGINKVDSYFENSSGSWGLLRDNSFTKDLYLSAKAEKEKHVRLLGLANEFTKNIQYSGVERKIVANSLLTKQWDAEDTENEVSTISEIFEESEDLLKNGGIFENIGRNRVLGTEEFEIGYLNTKNRGLENRNDMWYFFGNTYRDGLDYANILDNISIEGGIENLDIAYDEMNEDSDLQDDEDTVDFLYGRWELMDEEEDLNNIVKGLYDSELSLLSEEREAEFTMYEEEEGLKKIKKKTPEEKYKKRLEKEQPSEEENEEEDYEDLEDYRETHKSKKIFKKSDRKQREIAYLMLDELPKKK